jgi:hypothetical protein
MLRLLRPKTHRCFTWLIDVPSDNKSHKDRRSSYYRVYFHSQFVHNGQVWSSSKHFPGGLSDTIPPERSSLTHGLLHYCHQVRTEVLEPPTRDMQRINGYCQGRRGPALAPFDFIEQGWITAQNFGDLICGNHGPFYMGYLSILSSAFFGIFFP